MIVFTSLSYVDYYHIMHVICFQEYINVKPPLLKSPTICTNDVPYSCTAMAVFICKHCTIFSLLSVLTIIKLINLFGGGGGCGASHSVLLFVGVIFLNICSCFELRYM